MALRTAAQYRESLRDGRVVFYRGERVPDVTEHPVIQVAIEHASIDYEMAERPETRELAVVKSPETGEPISRYFHLPRTSDDLLKRSALIEAATREGGTLVVLIKEIGSDALFALQIVEFSRLASAASFLVLLGLAWALPAQADHKPQHNPGQHRPPPGPSPETEVTYTGRAFAAFVNVPTLGIGPQFISDTGELPPDGSPQSASLLNVAVPGVLSAELLFAHTSGANSVAESFAFLVGANVLNGLLTANAVGARSVATCNGVEGFTEVLDLTLAGQTITVDPFAPNQKFGPIQVDAQTTATLIINEQIQITGQGFREITVNAVHLTVEGTVQAEVILSSARSGIHGCPGCPPAPACHDFVTGGGWITVGSSRASFGFNAGFKGGSGLDAHFNYIDHSTGMHMKATSITEYEATAPTSRRFKGSAEIDGVAGQTYDIEVADNGEPGRNTDTISISLSNGLSNVVYSANGKLAGGNIQLHKPCP